MINSVIISAVLSYLLGSVNTSIFVSGIFGEGDIRKKGSGNAGATNTLRVLGAKAALLVVLGDALKGVLAVLLSSFITKKFLGITDGGYSIYIASVMVVIGHVYPLYFGFKGGKGIMTAIAVVFVLDYHIALILVAIFVCLIICFNYVSLASCICAFFYPVLVICIHNGNTAFFVSAVIVAVIAIYKHHTNISRLLNGTESKLFKKNNTR